MRLNRLFITIVCVFLVLATPLAWGQIAPYSQDFEALDPVSAAGNTALSADGWLVFGTEFFAGGGTNGYGPFPAPNKGPDGAAFSNVVTGQGGVPQGDQQLVVFNDYNNTVNHTAGNLVEASVYQEQDIVGAAAGTRVLFRFDAKMGDIAAPTTAIAFIKTLDPNAGFALSNFISIDTTNLPIEWSTYGIELDLDAAILGHKFQIGYASTTTNFVASGNVYDNVTLGPATVCPAEQVLANRKLETSSPQVRDAAISATVGPNFTAAGSSISVNAPAVIFADGVNIGGSFTAGNFPGSCTPV